ncbi:hypothetical protein ACFVFS_15160 [Kitasatospora sp. NPDC057692]|uniref:hypothetical protein n=1 Tax=Kitasatospora sp. NPDC057692 TaxID=3346215 RepID=UPI003699DE03
MPTLRLIRREARIAWPVAAVLALLAVLLTAIPLSWPPRFDRLAADTFADRVDRAQLERPLVLAATTAVPRPWLPPARPGTLDRDLDRIGEGLRAAAGPRTAAAFGRPRAAVTTAAGSPSGPGAPTAAGSPSGPGAPTATDLPQKLGLVHAQPAAGDTPVEYVEGRAPAQPEEPAGGRGGSSDPIEVAVSEATRDRLGMTLGREFDLIGGGMSSAVVPVGVFRTDHGADRLWRRNPMLVVPVVLTERVGRVLYGEMLTSAGGMELAANRGAGLTADWELPVALDRSGPTATPAGLAGLRSDLAALRSAPLERLCGDADCRLAGRPVEMIDVTEQLGREAEAFAGQRRRTEQLQGFALAGLLAVVVATAVAAARLGNHRRAGAFALQLTRGAGLPGIAGRLLAEAAVAVGAGAAAGWAVGRALAPKGAALGSPVPVLVAAVLVWCAPAAALLASAGRAGPVPRSRRLVLEALVVLLAVGGLVALRTRGAYAGSGIDPQLALAPVLLALVVVGALVRLLPPLLRGATRWARRSRGLVPLVALARAGTRSGAAALALLVLVLAMGYGVYGGLVPRTLGDGQAQLADWRTGGAVAALVGPKARFAGDLPPTPTAPHRVTVTGATGDLVSQDDGTGYEGVRLVGLDAAALGAAQPSSPLARALSAGSGLDARVRPVGDDNAVPVLTALADPELAARFPDGGFELSALGMDRALVRVVGALPEQALHDPVLGPVLGAARRSGPLLVFTGPSAERLPAQNRMSSAVLFYPAAGGPPSDPGALRSALAPQLSPGGNAGPPAEFRDRAAELHALRTDGLARSAHLAFRVTTVLGLLLGLGAFALDLLLSATERARTTSYLRTLGIGGRAVLGLQLLQLVPLVLSAAVGGTALGLLLPAALGPGMRLGAITGGPFEPAVHIDWTITAALGAALAVLMTAAAVLEAAIARRRGLGAVLRLGEAL